MRAITQRPYQGREATPVAQNPVIEKLVKGAVERCRERITAVRAGGGRVVRNGHQEGQKGITRGMKQSHGL
jgi:hypothetical protein